jgi:hypothetical protein
MLARRALAATVALMVLALPTVVRAEIINPGAMVGEYLFSPWGIVATLVSGWPALHAATGRPWRQSVWRGVALKLPTALIGPFLLWVTGGFVISFEPLGLAANVVASSAMYALLDLAALRVFLKTKPTRRAFAALMAANLVVLAVAMILFVTLDRELWMRARSAF